MLRACREQSNQALKAKKTGGLVIGRNNFGKISAVEGIQLTPIMNKRAVDAEQERDCPQMNIATPLRALTVKPERSHHF